MRSWFYLGENKKLHCEKPQFAYAYYLNFRLNLLTLEKENFDYKLWLESLDSLKLHSHDKPRVIHLFYELGHLLEDSGVSISSESMLGIDISYKECFEAEVSKLTTEENLFELKGSVSFEDYKNAFEKGYSHLEKGDCYQFNLTYPFKFKVDQDVDLEKVENSFFKNQFSSFAHATSIPLLNRSFLSQSPECLFQGVAQKNEIRLWTMPIKGTLPRRASQSEDWESLNSSFKDECELNMITDLLRNDFSRIEKPSTRVVAKKLPLFVPGLVHQFSIIENTFSQNLSLGRLIRSVFPGGSVTGAPKKRVLGILDELEKKSRGIYCGSTILLFKKKIAASINIRTADYDASQSELTYHAGGGITLLSKVSEEFDEMNSKVDSVFNTFN